MAKQLLPAARSANSNAPQNSAIVLSRPEKGTEPDRYLSARDIAQLTLRADSVIVSACQTAGGRVAAGEGVLGLPFAFFGAGARSTTLTLWEIYDDPATVVLVSALLRQAHRGTPPADALTAAKRELRGTQSEAIWAAFVFIGG